jgi:hypothetical protein
MAHRGRIFLNRYSVSAEVVKNIACNKNIVHAISVDTELELDDTGYTIELLRMQKAQQQSKPNLRMDAFEAEMVEAARFYNLQATRGQAKGYVPPVEAAFIAGACWAKEVLPGEGEE